MDVSGGPLGPLKKFEDAVASCNRCGFCTSYCPTYNATGNEAHSPRGRNQLLRALLEGKVTDPSQMKESFDTCLLCGECTSVCFSEVPTARLMMEARNYLNRTTGVPWPLRFFLGVVLPRPLLFRRLLRAAFIAKNLGLSTALRKMGLLKRISPELDIADGLLASAPVQFLLEYPVAKRSREVTISELSHSKALKEEKLAAARVQANPPARQKVAYMPVCGSQYIRPSIGVATLRLLERMKLELVIPDLLCCGLPAASYGVSDSVRSLAKENIARLERGHYDTILVDDSSCAAHLKDLPAAFQDDPSWLKRAHDVSQKVRDLSTTFLQRGLKEHLKLSPWTGGKVAYHDPCKAQYAQRLTNPPRELLGSIPRLDLVVVTDADQCCGGAGTYSIAHPEMSRPVLAAKVKNILSSGCSLLVTSSASCQVQVASGLRAEKSNIEVLHLSEFLLRALEKRR